MNRIVTRMVAIAVASVMTPVAMQATAAEPGSIAAQQNAVSAVEAWSGAGLSVYDFQLGVGFANRSSLSYLVTEFDNDRLLTFWKGVSLGVFLGVSDGGFLSLSIGR